MTSPLHPNNIPSSGCPGRFAEDEYIETDIFQVPGKRFSMLLLSIYGKPVLFIMLPLVTAGMAAGIICDLRWIIVAFMLLCIVVPMQLSFMYFYHALRPVTAINATPHKIRFTADGMLISAYVKKTERQQESDIAGEKEKKSNRFGFKPHRKKKPSKKRDSQPTEYTLHSDKFIPYSSVCSYVAGISSVTLHTSDPDKGIIWLPAKAFSGQENLQKALEKLIAGMRGLPSNSEELHPK